MSKYVCNLEKRHYPSKIIRKIEKQDGTIVTEQDDIVKETKYFYQHLYKLEEQNNDVNFEEIIPEQESIPKLTKEQCNSLEGKISQDKVLSPSKRMKNGTSPGSDGFTVEFLKFFWNDIGTLFVRAINESFRKESLSSLQNEGLKLHCYQRGTNRDNF